jgi:hypothetical protein
MRLHESHEEGGFGVIHKAVTTQSADVDHTSTCIVQSGETKAHDWMVAVLGRTAGHTVRIQHGFTASAGQRCGDVEIRNYLRDQAGSGSLVFDLSVMRKRFGSSSHHQQNGLLTIRRTSMRLCVLQL